jgi:anthranilate 1,2-dioxygenase (deaminating, decarboxylating) large subunit
LDPFYSTTLFVTQDLSISGRFHYLYNFANNTPDLGVGSGARTLQAGQAFHFNLAAAYAISPRVALGLNGYYLKQFTNSKINGTSAPGRSERVVGVGPGAVVTLDKDSYLFINAYAETLVENRSEGERILVRFVHHF